jgi:hypothetical protein
MVMDDVVQTLAGQFFQTPADQAFALGVEVVDLAPCVERIDAFAQVVEDGAQPGLLPLRDLLQRLLRRDFGADGDVLLGLAALIQERGDGGVHPVEAARLVAIADVAVPGTAVGDGAPHVLIDLRRVLAGFEDAVVLAQQFLARIPADPAEAVVGEGDAAGDVGHADDGVLIECVLQPQGATCDAQAAPPQMQQQRQDHGGEHGREQAGVDQRACEIAGAGRQQVRQDQHDREFAEEGHAQHRGQCAQQQAQRSLAGQAFFGGAIGCHVLGRKRIVGRL